MAANGNLLLGILAVQLGFITQSALLETMNAWLVDKSQSLGQLLMERGYITSERLQLLSALVSEHIRQHDNDPEKSLAALPSIESTLRQDLAALPDADVHATMIQLGAARSADATGPDSNQTISQTPRDAPMAGRYRILRQHARGGLGEVFLAEDSELGRKVAVKEIQPRFAEDSVNRSRFVLEAEITGGLEHPGIVPVYGLGAYADGRPYYAMRFIKGDNLKSAIDRFHRGNPAHRNSFASLEFRGLLRRFVDVCNAVAYAHSRGVLHRDLKPGNVMLGKYGETLVVDWGLAKYAGSPQGESTAALDETVLKPRSGADASVTVAGSAMGTPAYMPPEQAAGEWHKLGPASDVYSLGATLYDVLTGHKPFAGQTDDVLAQVRRGEFPAPRTVNAAVPRALDAVCLKAMARDPSDRYDSPLDLSNDLERWLADEPVSAWSEPLAVRGRRWMRRHRALVTGLAAALVVALIGAAIGLWVLDEKNRALALANRNEQRQRERAEGNEKQANLERDRADQEKRVAQAVRAFLQEKLLGQADTASQADALLAAGRSSTEAVLDPRISVLLDRAAEELTPEKIESRFPGQPLVQAEILHTIGNAYRGVGKYQPAIRHLERARDLRLAQLGADHHDTLLTLNNLALAYLHAGNTPESMRIFERVYKGEAKTLSADHLNTLTTLVNVGGAYLQAGKFAEAIQLYELMRESTIATLGSDHPLTLTMLNNLAGAYMQSGKMREAIPVLESVRDAQIVKLGSDHPATLGTQNNLAAAYLHSGNPRAAIPLFEKIRDVRANKLGYDHPDTLNSKNNIAYAYHLSGRYSEAIELYKLTCDALAAKLGADHPSTLSTFGNLAAAYRDSGKPGEAITILLRVRDAQAAKLGPDHPETLVTRTKLADAYRKDSRLSEAIQLYEQLSEPLRTQFGREHPVTIGSLAGLAGCYQDAGKLPDAIRLFEQVRDSHMTQRGADHPDTLTALSNLALAYTRAGRGSEAIPLFAQAAAGIEKLQFQSQHASRIVHNAIRGYEDAKRFNDAEVWRRKWLTVLKSRSKLDSADYAAELAGLGLDLLRQHKTAEAESTFRESLRIQEKLEVVDWTVSNTRSLLGESVAEQRKFAEAEPLLLQGLEGLQQHVDKIPAANKSSVPDAAQRLVRLYEAWGKPDEVAKWREELNRLNSLPDKPKP